MDLIHRFYKYNLLPVDDWGKYFNFCMSTVLELRISPPCEKKKLSSTLCNLYLYSQMHSCKNGKITISLSGHSKLEALLMYSGF
jgi:hypothetical protein